MIIKNELQIKKIFQGNRDPKQLFVSLNSFLPKYEINTTERVASFLGQAGYESQEFMFLTENLNYTADGLVKIFPAFFPNHKKALQYQHQPTKIANLVYASRMGNGNETSGDGWMFRGHGFLQITGRYMFEKFATHLKMNLNDTMVYAKTLNGAMEISCWYWQSRNINPDADRLDITGITQKINSKLLGLEKRKYYTRMALSVLSETTENISPSTLKYGDTGEHVLVLQRQLVTRGYRVAIDGHYGKGTENAIKQLQTQAGLKPDGIAGPQTRMLLQ